MEDAGPTAIEYQPPERDQSGAQQVVRLVRSPDAISIELLQKGDALPPKEPLGINGQHWEDRSKRCAMGSRDFV